MQNVYEAQFFDLDSKEESNAKEALSIEVRGRFTNNPLTEKEGIMRNKLIRNIAIVSASVLLISFVGLTSSVRGPKGCEVNGVRSAPVSYTHLTLPTILLV